jgi:multicomponent Na+:H+ antiporter subunit E
VVAERVLVPVAPSSTLRATVGYAVRSIVENASAAEPATLVFVSLYVPDTRMERSDEQTPGTALSGDGHELLDRASVWVDEDAGDDRDAIRVETVQLGTEEYLFSPTDVAGLIGETLDEREIDRLVLDPGYDPGVGVPLLRPLEYELTRLTDVTIEVAPVQSAVRRSPLLARANVWKVLVLFAVCFGFYMILAGTIDRFELVTGLASATVATVALSRIALGRSPTAVGSPVRFARGVLYVPYLLFEILKANVAVAAVILDPRLPIEPHMTRIEPAVYGSLPLTSLANSITLTPGTLTVRVEDQSLLVHTLVPSAQQGLFDGSLERAIRFVFYGRAGMRVASLDERGAATVLDDPVGPGQPRTGPADATDEASPAADGEPPEGGEDA